MQHSVGTRGPSSMCERAEYGLFRDLSTRHRVCMADNVLESPQGPDPA